MGASQGAPHVAQRFVRWKAIGCALWYGILPSRLYERENHYAPMSYWSHLRMNLVYAAKWLTGREDDGDCAFELEVNGAR